MSLTAIIHLFLLEAATGSLLTLWALGRFELAPSLRRFLAGLGGALAAAALPFGMRAFAPEGGGIGTLLAPPILWAVALITLCAVYAARVSMGAGSPNLLAAAAAAGLMSIFLGSGVQAGAPSGAPALLRAGYFLTSALFLGGTLGTMILGHWYLVDRKMAIEPLRFASALLLLAVAARIAVVAWPAVQFWTAGGAQGGAGMESLHLTILWTQRALFGLAGPLALGIMVWQTARLRATQAATGLLYIVLIFAIVGELTSHYLYLKTGRLL